VFFSSLSETNLRKHVILDRSTTGVSLSHVVRRNPTITSVHKYGLPNSSASSTMSFGSNNDDNGPNVGSGYGRSAAIANPSILFSCKWWTFSYPRNSCSCWI